MLYLVANYATCKKTSSNLSDNESLFISNNMNVREHEQLTLHWKPVYPNAFVFCCCFFLKGGKEGIFRLASLLSRS